MAVVEEAKEGEHGKGAQEEAGAAARLEIRKRNLAAIRPNEGELKGMDSRIQKCTGLTKKLRLITEDSKDSLINEIRRVNLTKYVSEAVVAIVECKLKAADVSAVVAVCSELHGMYEEFAELLIPNLSRTLGVQPIQEKKKGATAGKQMPTELGVVQAPSPGRKRATLKLLLELMLVGLYECPGPILPIVQELSDAKSSNDGGSESIEQGGDGSTGAVPLVYRKQFRNCVERAFKEATSALLHQHKALQKSSERNARDLATRLVLREGAAEAHEDTKKTFEALQRSVMTLATEILDCPVPELPTVQDADVDVATIEVVTDAFGNSENTGPFDSEEERNFYESLPDLRAALPPALFAENTETKVGEDVEMAEVAETGDKEKAVRGGASIEKWFSRLATIASADSCDGLASDFCYICSKNSRKRLVKGFAMLPREESNLVPYMSRLIATLAPCYKEMVPALVEAIDGDFKCQMKKHDAKTLDARIRDVHILGELCKFRLVSPDKIFACWSACLEDFRHHNIEVACFLMETCGRFLYRNPETQAHMNRTLEVMMGKKASKKVDEHHEMLLDNAFYTCRPPENPAGSRMKERPPLHEYIRHLIFNELKQSKSSVSKVAQQMRKLPWEDKECEHYIIKCAMKVHKGSFSHIPSVASLIATLNRYHDTVSIFLVDEILEELRCGLERTLLLTQRTQRHLSYCRLLGELYNCKLIDSKVILDTLYFILAFGYPSPKQKNNTNYYNHGTPPPPPPPTPTSRDSWQNLDPLDDYTRIRWINTLLSTCRKGLDRGR